MPIALWWRVQVTYRCTMDDIWSTWLSFQKQLWPHRMEELHLPQKSKFVVGWFDPQPYWGVTQRGSQKDAWARTMPFFGLYSILNLCIVCSRLSHIRHTDISVQHRSTHHIHRIIYPIYYIELYIRTCTEYLQIKTYQCNPWDCFVYSNWPWHTGPVEQRRSWKSQPDVAVGGLACGCDNNHYPNAV